MGPLTPPAAGESATLLSIVCQLWETRMTRLLAPHGLTLSQFGILHHVARPVLDGGQRISDIARALEAQQPAVTKAVAKFETMGLVTLSPVQGDKRAKLVSPTPAAAALVQQIRVSMGPDIMQVFGGMEPDVFDGFTRGLRHLARWLDQNRL